MANNLPNGYVELEYIESTGTQYIDTGVVAPYGFRTTFEIEFPSAGDSEECIIGSSDIYAPYYRNYVDTYPKARWNFGANEYYLFGGYETNKPIRVDANNKSGNISYIMNDDPYDLSAFNPSSVNRSEVSLYIFALHFGTRAAYFGIFKLYSMQIFVDGTMVRNYIPCKNPSGDIGLFDKANNVFYCNSGTGSFVTGPEIIPLVPKEFIVRNLVKDASFENSSWNGGVQDTEHVKYGNFSRKLVGTTGSVELTMNTSTDIPLNPTHIYYTCVDVYQETSNGSVDIYWPISEPNFLNGQTSKPNQWTRISSVNNRNSFSAGNYALRLDYNNLYIDNSMWYDGVMLIDLTESFGAGNEPNKEWCDKNIPFFEGSYVGKIISPPTNLSATISNGRVNLFWDESETEVDGYRIYQNGVLVGETPMADPMFEFPFSNESLTKNLLVISELVRLEFSQVIKQRTWYTYGVSSYSGNSESDPVEIRVYYESYPEILGIDVSPNPVFTDESITVTANITERIEATIA